MDDTCIPVRVSDLEFITNILDKYDYHMDPDNKTWLETPGNVAYRIGDNIGLATLDYPGLYCVHWFFTAKGKEAIRICQTMLDKVFSEHGAEAVRGVTPIDNKPARFLAKYVGCETISIETFADGTTCELMLLSKERFNQFKEKNKWR